MLKEHLKTPYILPYLYARQFLFCSPIKTRLRANHPCSFLAPCARLPSLSCPQGSGSCLHRAITLSGCVELARFTASETTSFTLCTWNSFLWKGSFSNTLKGKKQMAQQWQVPALFSSHLPDGIPFFAFHKAGWREWYLSPGSAVPNHEHI